MNAQRTDADATAGEQSRELPPSEWGKTPLRHVQEGDEVTVFDPHGSDEAYITAETDLTVWPRCEA